MSSSKTDPTRGQRFRGGGVGRRKGPAVVVVVFVVSIKVDWAEGEMGASLMLYRAKSEWSDEEEVAEVAEEAMVATEEGGAEEEEEEEEPNMESATMSTAAGAPGHRLLPLPVVVPACSRSLPARPRTVSKRKNRVVCMVCRPSK